MPRTQYIQHAVTLLQQGGLVAFPTETVYGLGADARNEAAIRRIFQAKQRPFDHPLIVHLANLAQLSDWAKELSPLAKKLAERYWPGPLTLILQKQPGVLDILTAGQPTIAIRIPRHPIAQALLQAFGGGIAAPSANQFTHVSPTNAAAVREELRDSVDLILDGGDCEIGLESTIIDMSQAQPMILRPGMLTLEALSDTLGVPVLSGADQHEESLSRAPGMHHLHYAPLTNTRLIESAAIPTMLANLTGAQAPVALMVYQSYPSDHQTVKNVHWCRMPDNAEEYAHVLYQTLRQLDKQAFKQIFIEAVPQTPAWHAIRDRLTKATGREEP
jgi:L-threonylcarbamoyladenylate synthase